MTRSRYDLPRRVVQAYRRIGDGQSVDNPYPTLDSATRAIESDVVLAPPNEPEAPSVVAPEGITGAPDISWQEMGPGGSRGAVFGSRDEAARAALEATNNWSRALNREYRWFIYKDAEGNYRYTPPEYGGLKGGRNVRMARPPGQAVGFGHTHGDYSTEEGRVSRSQDAYNSDDFSSTPGDDYDFMRKNRDRYEAFYLGTPSGHFYEWTRQGGKRPFK